MVPFPRLKRLRCNLLMKNSVIKPKSTHSHAYFVYSTSQSVATLPVRSCARRLLFYGYVFANKLHCILDVLAWIYTLPLGRPLFETWDTKGLVKRASQNALADVIAALFCPTLPE